MRLAAIRAGILAVLMCVALSASARAEHSGMETIVGPQSVAAALGSKDLAHVYYKRTINDFFYYSHATGTSTTIATAGPVTLNAVAADGSRVIISTTSKLTASDTDSQVDIYAWAQGVFTLISVGPAGGNGAFASEFRGANEDATHIYHTTLEQLVSEDTDSASDLYQTVGGTTDILSLGPFGGNSTGSALFGGASADGERVFFGTSDQLTSDDMDAYTDTYEYSGGTVTRVSTGPAGGNGPAGVAYAGNTPDGSRVFFQTREALTPDDTDDNNRDTYSRAAGVTQLESTGPLAPAATIAIFRGASADGSKVFFSTTEPLLLEDQDIYTDIYERSGGTTTLISKGPDSDSAAFPAAFNGISEDGTKVFFLTGEPLVSGDTDGGFDIYERSGGTTTLVSTSATDPQTLKHAAFQGVSTDGERVFFTTDEALVPQDTNTGMDLYERHAGTTSRYTVGPFSFGFGSSLMALSPGGERLLVKVSGAVSLGVAYIGPYVRPRGATPTRVPLVPAFSECTSPNLVHGPGLEFGSCGPPQQTSGNLTVGTPDANGATANSAGSVVLSVIAGAAGPPDDSDVAIRVQVSDIRCAGAVAPCGPSNVVGGDDYTGELSAVPPLRITDELHDGPSTGTTQDGSFPVTVPCAATAAADRGGDCAVVTSANAVVPGAVSDAKRAIWQLGQIDVHDGGPDGDAETTGDNSRFATQGLFVP